MTKTNMEQTHLFIPLFFRGGVEGVVLFYIKRSIKSIRGGTKVII